MPSTSVAARELSQSPNSHSLKASLVTKGSYSVSCLILRKYFILLLTTTFNHLILSCRHTSLLQVAHSQCWRHQTGRWNVLRAVNVQWTLYSIHVDIWPCATFVQLNTGKVKKRDVAQYAELSLQI